MQLVIDIGNTRIKAALFDGDELMHSFVFDSPEAFLSSGITGNYPIEHCILASVVDGIEACVEALKKNFPVLAFSTDTITPLKNLYKSAQTLGSDRLAGAVGGNALFPDKNVLVIDAGTCIKYNFVNSSNEYMGGGISPGLQMRFKALHTFTSRLPLVDVDENFQELIGKDSKESILSGVQMGAVAEVEGIIERYKLQYPDVKVVLTGGDVNFFAERLKNSIFADQFLILKGLNRILKSNLIA
jgi:type III pantothenate kinase